MAIIKLKAVSLAYANLNIDVVLEVGAVNVTPGRGLLRFTT
jgi:hypothetical protein